MTPLRDRLFQQPWPEGEFRFFQLGFVVDDLLQVAERWTRVQGVGPFHVFPRVAADCTYRGAPSKLDLQIAVAQAGPVQIELIQQYGDGPSVYRDWLRQGASHAFHQICTVTQDYDGKRSHYESLGYELASEMKAGSGRIAFYDTVRDFGFFTEVAESSPSFLANLAKVARTCAAWDGSDPVRLITRDGYRTP
ncbi:MAG TPA: VOC family protein [Myxococcota bacterium]|nr:VOC family protein [Myxococcota bacterium]